MLAEDLEGTTSYLVARTEYFDWFLDLLRGQLFCRCLGLGNEYRYTLVQHHVWLVCICELVGNRSGDDHLDRCVI